MNTYEKKVSVLVLLDHSAAFNAVDHNILLGRLEHWTCLSGTVLKQFRSYLTGWQFYVAMDDHSFHKIDLTCGGPQGFILGPIPFSLYVLPFCIIGHNKINFHNHADDTHLFISVSMNDYSFIKNMIACISDISLWMTLNFLPLNQDKTHILVIGAKETDYLKLFAQ